MKNSTLIRSIFTITLLCIVGVVVGVASPKNYKYNVKTENDRIVEKEVFLEEGGLLKRMMMYEFEYNEEGFVAEKRVYKWSERTRKWEPYYLMTYDYNAEDENIKSRYVMWDQRSKDYCVNEQYLMIPVENYESIFS